MSDNDEERSERVSTNVTPDTKRALRVKAAQSDLTMAEFLRDVIEEELGETGNGTKIPTTAD